MFDLTEEEELEARLRDAAAARSEALGLRAQLAAATAEVEERARQVEQARAALASEQEDVDRLTSFSLRGVLASLAGREAGDLEREVAERDAARYALAAAEDRVSEAMAERARIEDRLITLGDADRAWQEASAERDAWLARSAEHASSSRVVTLAERRGAIVAELRECDEAIEAGARATAELAGAAELLGHLDAWTPADLGLPPAGAGDPGDGPDTPAGEALEAAEDRLDEAARWLQRADTALDVLRHELADLVELGTVDAHLADPQRWGHLFDPFFDRLFDDLGVRQRLERAVDAIAIAHRSVETAIDEVGERRRALLAEAEALAGEREQLRAARSPDTPD